MKADSFYYLSDIFKWKARVQVNICARGEFSLINEIRDSLDPILRIFS